MRAAVFKGAGLGLAIEERPEPAPGPGEVVIRICRAGICGSDLHAASGHGQQAPIGRILGHEFCGEVVALGAGVRRLRLGDRVAPLPFIGCGHCAACLAGRSHHCAQVRFDPITAFSQYSLAGENECVVLPPVLSDEEGALIEPLAVGLQGVRKAQLPIGARVLVTGAGPIGLSAAFWAMRLGASRIAVMASSERRATIARALGASHFIAQREVADPQAAIRDALNGDPDVVFEAVGLPGAIGEAIDYVKPLGTVISLGYCSEPDTFIPTAALRKEVRLLFSMCYDRDDFQYTAGIMAGGDRRPLAMVTDTVRLEALPEKFNSLLRNETPDCKVMIDPWGG